jgi:hypothetical protein
VLQLSQRVGYRSRGRGDLGAAGGGAGQPGRDGDISVGSVVAADAVLGGSGGVLGVGGEVCGGGLGAELSRSSTK